MSAGYELSAASKWLYTTLAADSALAAVVSTRIYADLAPQAAAHPLVVFQFQGGVDFQAVGAIRIWSNLELLIRGIDQTTTYTANLRTIAKRIDAVLHAASGSNVDGVIIACTRLRPFQLTELTDGVQYRHLGGFYRLLAQ
jgi:hypothetical protein